jgi:hypothetical protein
LSPHNIEQIYQCLYDFDFARLLVQELHCFSPISKKVIPIDDKHTRREIARIKGVPVIEITATDGKMPDAHTRVALHTELSLLFPNRLLIFLDGNRTQSIWLWIKREYERTFTREYVYFRGQPGECFLDKLQPMITETLSRKEVLETSTRKEALRLFGQGLEAQRHKISQHICGIQDIQQRTLYGTVLLNRLILLYFLQERGVLNDGDPTYLEAHLESSSDDNYYRHFLCPLFKALFPPHTLEMQYPDIQVSDIAFQNLFAFFTKYQWSIMDISSDPEHEFIITPNILGELFERRFRQKTKPEITEYLCRQTINQRLLDKVNQKLGDTKQSSFQSVDEMLEALDVPLCRTLLEILSNLSIVDPAYGSGTFLIGALNTLTLIYTRIISKISNFDDTFLIHWFQNIHQDHPNVVFFLKQKIMVENLFGVDLAEEAIECTRLRLYLSLISALYKRDQMKPFPNMDSNLHSGNALIGLLHAEDSVPVQKDRFNDVLLAKLTQVYSRHGQRKSAGRSIPASPTLKDVEQLAPFHWANAFHDLMEVQGGFDIVLTNPPWESLKPETSPTAYYQSLFYKFAPQYTHQRAPINLYKIFVEQCNNLLCNGGCCGVITPSGLCIDYSTIELRQMIVNKTRILGLFCFRNTTQIIQDLDRRFEVALLTFQKGQTTKSFPTAFFKAFAAELDTFPKKKDIYLSTVFLQRFSPDALDIGRFRDQQEVDICVKMLQFPFLGEEFGSDWNVRFVHQLHLTSEKDNLNREGIGQPLYEGNMIHQFTYTVAPPRYWISKERIREMQEKGLLYVSQNKKRQKALKYLLVFRAIATNTQYRTLVATLLPSGTLVSDSLVILAGPLDARELLLLTAIFNSFLADFFIRFRVSSPKVSTRAVSQLPVPHPAISDEYFLPIVKRVARLICTTSDFKDLWSGVMHKPWLADMAATNPVERGRLCAELDGLIAHLYQMTENEFVSILSTFPSVADPIRVAAWNAYRDVSRGLII